MKRAIAAAVLLALSLVRLHGQAPPITQLVIVGVATSAGAV